MFEKIKSFFKKLFGGGAQEEVASSATRQSAKPAVKKTVSEAIAINPDNETLRDEMARGLYRRNNEGKFYPVCFSYNGLTIETDGKKAIIVEAVGFGDEQMVIPSKVDKFMVEAIGPEGFGYNTQSTEIHIEEGIKKIMKGAFIFGFEIQTIYIPSSITTIEKDAFRHNAELRFMAIPQTVKAIGKNIFNECPKLEKVILPTFVKNYTDEHSLYLGLPIEKVEFRDVTAEEAEELTKEYLAQPPIEDGCEEEVYESTREHVDLAGLEYMGDAKTIGGSRYKNDKYEVEIDGDTLVIVKYTGDDADYRKVKIPDEFGGIAPTAIGSYAFTDNRTVDEIIIPSSVTSCADHAFCNNFNLKRVYISNSVEEIGEEAFAMCDRLAEVIIPCSVTKLGKDAFYGCDELKNLVLPNHFKDAVDANPEIFGCPKKVIKFEDIGADEANSKKTVVSDEEQRKIDDLNNQREKAKASAEEFRKMKQEFRARWKTESPSFYMRNFNAADFAQKVEAVNSGKSEEQYLGEGNEGGKVYCIKDYICERYENGKDCIIWDYSGDEKILELPGRLAGYKVVRIGIEAFAGTFGLEELILPNTLDMIDACAFAGCTSMKSVFIPAGVKRIEARAFNFCTDLTEVIVPNTIDTMYSGVFSNCSSLTKVVVPTMMREFIQSNKGYLGVDNSIIVFEDVAPKRRVASKMAKGVSKGKAPSGYMYVGYYPQSLKDDSVKISIMYTSKGDRFFGDDGCEYAYKKGNYYKIEPVKWRIIGETDSEYILMTDKIMESSLYAKALYDDGYGTYVVSDNSYSCIAPVVNKMYNEMLVASDSGRYVWMSINDAKDEYEKDIIMSVTDDYEDEPDDMDDELECYTFIPNMTDIFDHSATIEDNLAPCASRVLEATDYAGDVKTWWLRQSPYGEKWLNYFVNEDGSINTDIDNGTEEDINSCKRGIVLLMHYAKDEDHNDEVNVHLFHFHDMENNDAEVITIPYGTSLLDANCGFAKDSNAMVMMGNTMEPWNVASPIYTDNIGIVKYDGNLFHRVIYHLDGGANILDNRQFMMKTMSFDLVDLPNEVHREDGRWCTRPFKGWFSDAAFTQPITKVVGCNDDIHIYAKWGKKSYIDAPILHLDENYNISKTASMYIACGEYPQELLCEEDEATLKHVEGDIYVSPSGARYVKSKYLPNGDLGESLISTIPQEEYYYRLSPVKWVVTKNGDDLELATLDALHECEILSYLIKSSVEEKSKYWQENRDTATSEYNAYSDNMGIKIYEMFKQMFTADEVANMKPCDDENYKGELMVIPAKDEIVEPTQDDSMCMNAFLFNNIGSRTIIRVTSDFADAQGVIFANHGTNWYLRDVTNYRTACVSIVDNTGCVNPFSGLDTIGKAVNDLDDGYGLVLRIVLDNAGGKLVDTNYVFDYSSLMAQE